MQMRMSLSIAGYVVGNGFRFQVHVPPTFFHCLRGTVLVSTLSSYRDESGKFISLRRELKKRLSLLDFISTPWDESVKASRRLLKLPVPFGYSLWLFRPFPLVFIAIFPYLGRRVPLFGLSGAEHALRVRLADSQPGSRSPTARARDEQQRPDKERKVLNGSSSTPI